jgi:hypothetical protein
MKYIIILTILVFSSCNLVQEENIYNWNHKWKDGEKEEFASIMVNNDINGMAEAINFTRRFRYMSDMKQYGLKDHQCSPVQSLGNGYGDCDDFSNILAYSLAYLKSNNLDSWVLDKDIFTIEFTPNKTYLDNYSVGQDVTGARHTIVKVGDIYIEPQTGRYLTESIYEYTSGLVEPKIITF